MGQNLGIKHHSQHPIRSRRLDVFRPVALALIYVRSNCLSIRPVCNLAASGKVSPEAQVSISAHANSIDETAIYSGASSS
jgi:hypothetical protein